MSAAGPADPVCCLLVAVSAQERAPLAGVARLRDIDGAVLAGREPPVDVAVDGAVDVVVVGSGIASAVAAVQQAHRHFPDAAIVVLARPGAEEDLRRSLTYAPGVPLEMLVRVAGEPLADELAELRAGVAERRRHHAVLAALAARSPSPVATRPTAVVALGALLDHAPLGVVVVNAEDGAVLGWNRRAATLLRLSTQAQNGALEEVLPGAGTALGLAFPWAGTSGAGAARDDGEPVVLTAAGSAELEVSVVPSQLDDGRLVALVSLVDVTQRRQAERDRQRLSGHVALLSRVSESLAGTLDMDAALDRLAAELVPAVSDWVAVQLVDEQRVRAVVMRHRDPAMTPVVAALERRQKEATAPSAPSQQTARSGEPQLLRHVDEETLERIAPDPELRALARQLGTASVLAVPMRGRYAVHGSIVLVNGPGSPELGDADQALAVEVGRRAAVALDSAQLYAQQRDLAQELQRSLLTPPPATPLGRIEVRYKPAAHEAQVGGDWYDAFVQPDGATVLVIGDVIGHDVRAAAGMSQLRGVLRGIAYTTGAGPAEILRRADEANQGLLVATTATALVATLRPATDPAPGRLGGATLTWSAAGHPPPMVVHPDGRVGVLGRRAGHDVDPDLLLGLDPGTPRHDHEVVLAPGATLLLYTDGLVERRGESLDVGIARLAGALRDLAGAPLEELCDATLRHVLPSEQEDDVALVAIELRH